MLRYQFWFWCRYRRWVFASDGSAYALSRIEREAREYQLTGARCPFDFVESLYYR